MSQPEIEDIKPRSLPKSPFASCGDAGCAYCGDPKPNPKPPGMTLAEAIEALRQGKRVTNTTWEAGCYAGAIGETIYDQNGESIEIHVVLTALSGLQDREWQIYEAAPPVTTELSTVEALAALADGKRVRQVHQATGPIYHLHDGYFRSDKGTCSDSIALTATDLMQSRYRIEP